MSKSISSSTHAGSAAPVAKATSHAKIASQPPRTAKSTPLPQDIVKLSRQAQAAPAAKN